MRFYVKCNEIPGFRRSRRDQIAAISPPHDPTLQTVERRHVEPQAGAHRVDQWLWITCRGK
jgi:hypothetical protein